MNKAYEIVVAATERGYGSTLQLNQYLLSIPDLSQIEEMMDSLKTMSEVAHARKFEIRCSESERVALQTLDFGDIEVIFEIVSENKINISRGVEITCMDRREHHAESAKYTSDLPKVTYPASALFLYPEISSKLKEAGLSHLVNNLKTIISKIQSGGLQITKISNHHGIDGDGGCGGLNAVKDVCDFVTIKDAKDYLAVMRKVRDIINADFGGIAKGASLLSYPTKNGVVVGILDLENPKDLEILQNSERVVF